MQEFTNTFLEGLDRDSPFTSYSNKRYYSATNMRFISDTTAASGTLTNMPAFDVITDILGYDIVGNAIVGDYVILFLREQAYPARGHIYRIPFSEFDTKFIIDSNFAETKSLDGYSYQRFNSHYFNFGDKVEVIALYETADIVKLYWLSDGNPLRYLNLLEEDTRIILYAADVDNLSIVKNVIFSTPTFSELTSGNLYTGAYQYSYNLFNKNGTESIYSPASQIIPISSDDYSGEGTHNFKGSTSGEESGKGIVLNITTTGNDFEYVRVVRLYYPDQISVPEITIIYEGERSNSITVYDTGQTLGSLIVEELNENPNLFIAKTLEVKDNYLFAGNIENIPFPEESLDSYNPRMIRFKSSQTSSTLYSGYALASSTSGNIATLTAQTSNLFNPFNKIAVDSSGGTYDYKYQSDSTTLGGSGLGSSKYEFITQSMPYDDASTRYAVTGTDYNNYINPTNYNYIGYQRDEVYRFGIRFINNKGQSSFVKWIDDIRMPNYGNGNNKNVSFSFTPVSDDINVANISYTITFKSLGNTITTAASGLIGGTYTKAAFLNEFVTAARTSPSISSFFYVYTDNTNVIFTSLYSSINTISIAFSSTSGNYDGTPIVSADFVVVNNSTAVTNDFDIVSPTAYTTNQGVTFYSNALGVKFTFDFSEIDDSSITHYQVVRAIRESHNSTVIDNGIGSALTYTGDYLRFSEIGPTSSADSLLRTMVEYTSPEILYNKSYDITGDVLEGTRMMINDGINVNIDTIGINKSSTAFSNLYIKKVVPTMGFSATINSRRNIYTKLKITPNNDYDTYTTLPSSFGTTKKLRGYAIKGLGPLNYYSTKGSSLLLKIADLNPFYTYLNPLYTYLYSRRRRYVAPYNDTTTNSLENTQYIECSPITPLATTTIEVYGGDTFISPFEYNRLLWYRSPEEELTSDTKSFAQVVIAPIESKLNLNYINNSTTTSLGTTSQDSSIQPYYAIRETKGIHDVYVSNEEITFYTQDFDLYIYNSTYSRINNYRTHIAKPSINTFIDEMPNRVYASDKKFAGEVIDSFTKFRPNNYIDVDGTYGYITKLINYNNKLIFFQPRAFGVIGTGEKELVQTNNTSGLIVGTGTLLSRFDYISISSGSDQINGILRTSNGLYYIDIYNRKIARLTDKLEFISDTKNINSWFKPTTKTEDTYSLIYNPLHSEVWIINNKDNNQSILLSELSDRFVSFLYDNYYKYYNYGFVINDRFLTIKNGYASSGYIVNNDSILSDNVCAVELIINPAATNMFRFDTVKFNSMSDSFETVPFTSVICSNSYQTSANLITTLTNKLRSWRANIIRDDTLKARFVDNYMKLALTINSNLSGGSYSYRQIKLNNISTIVSPINLR